MRGHEYHVKEVRVDTERPPLEWFLEKGASKMKGPEDPFATFTRPIPRQSPPDSPAGLDQASERAKKRWQGDSFRLQVYQYEERNLVVDKNGPRRPLPEEQLRMMGFCSNHLTAKNRLSNDLKGQMIGNSFSAISVARLLVGLVATPEQCKNKDVTLLLWQVWQQKEQKARQEDKPWKIRFSSVAAGAPGAVSLVHEILPSPVAPLRSLIDPQGWLTDEEALSYLLARNGTHRNAGNQGRFGNALCCWRTLSTERGSHTLGVESAPVIRLEGKRAAHQRLGVGGCPRPAPASSSRSKVSQPQDVDPGG